MDITDKTPYIPDSSDDSWSLELLPKQYSNKYEALIDNHSQLNLERNQRLDSIDKSSYHGIIDRIISFNLHTIINADEDDLANEDLVLEDHSAQGTAAMVPQTSVYYFD